MTTWTIKALPRGDEDEPGDVTIERDDAHIIVHWVCGASRTFTPAALRRALGLFEAVIANDGTGDLWYGDSDSPGQAYVARLDNGNFVADANIVEDAYMVPWEEFESALRKAIPKPRKTTRKDR